MARVIDKAELDKVLAKAIRKRGKDVAKHIIDKAVREFSIQLKTELYDELDKLIVREL